MSLIFQDLRDDTNDLNSNYTASNLDSGNTDRAINRAIEYVQRRMGLPSDEKIYSFYYFEDTKYYDMPTGWNEFISLDYNSSSLVDVDHNVPRNLWTPSKDVDILRDTGRALNTRRVAFTTINGKNQLLMTGSNIRGSSIIYDFDSTNSLTFSSSISNTSTDTNVKKQGSGSLKFDMDNSESDSDITISGNWDITSQLNLNTSYKVYVDFPASSTTQLSSIELRFQSSSGNYYSMTATTQDDGTAWATGWNRLNFSLANISTVGSPDATAITSIIILFNHSGSFTGITNFRIDYLYEINPDYMDVIYYSAYKGTDSTGATNKIILTDAGDIVSFGDYAQDLRLPIAIKAATILNPQLRGDINFLQLYKADFTDTLKIFGKIYPRKRSTGAFGTTQFLR